MQIDDLIGKPFRLGAAGPAEYDCWHLCREVSHRAGIELPAVPSVTDPIERDSAIKSTSGRFLKLDRPEPFCLVTLRMRGRLVTHIGVVLKDCQRFIHAVRDMSVCIENLEDWRERIDGYYEYIG